MSFWFQPLLPAAQQQSGPAAYTLVCDPATLTLTGQSVALKRSLKISCTPASLRFTGGATVLIDLESYWSLDETSGNALDAHGSNDLTDVNTVGSGTGKVSGARLFTTADSDKLAITDNASFDIGDADFTFTFWVKFVDFGTGGLIHKYGSAGNREYLIYQSSGQIHFLISSDGTNVADASYNHSGGLVADTWYFVIAEYDATANEVRIGVQGATPATASHSGGVYNSGSDFALGTEATVVGGPDAYLDEVGFWKRLLTTDEVNFLYNSGAGRAYESFSTVLRKGYTLSVTPGALALTGQTVALRKAYRLVADPGTLSVTGSSVALNRGRRLTADAGALALTGQTVALRKGYILGVTPASLSLTGQSVTLRASRRVAVTQGSLALAGQSVALKRSLKLAASPASLSLAGQTVNLRKGYVLGATPASLSLTGQSVALKRGLRLPVTEAGLSLSGQAVTLRKGYVLGVTPASLSLTGQTISIPASRKVAVTPGALAVTGQTVGLNYGRRLAVTPASLALTGQSVGLPASRKVPVTAGALLFNGQNVDLVYDPLSASYSLTCDPGALVLTGQAVGVRAGRRVAVTPGALALSGQAAALRRSGYVGVTPGALTLTGQTVNLIFGGTPALIYTRNFPFTRAQSSASLLSRTSGSVRLVTTASGNDELV